MYVTSSASERFDPAKVVDPDRRGAVAWSQFNESFESMQQVDWWRINEGTRHGPLKRFLRLGAAYVVRKRDAILDLERKAAAIARFPIKRDPDIVFFGAEAGWEALLVQSLFGAGGKVLLIDAEPAAYERYLHSPEERRIRAPRGFPDRELVLRRDRARIEYLQADYFDVQRDRSFDVGIDWGIIEHYDDARKLDVMRNFQRFLREDGIEISSCPRDTYAVRYFYWLFRDELNFGYRELMTLREFVAQLERGGYEVVATAKLPAHNVAAARVLRGR